MKSISVTGYKMATSPETGETKRIGGLTTTEVSSHTDEVEFIEGLASIKLGCDWFEAVTMQIN